MKTSYPWILLLLWIFLQISLSAKFDLFAQSMKCFNVNPKIIVNLTYKMTPVRGKCSLIFITAVVVRTPRVLGRMTLYYKYTGGFRPYLLDMEFDACEVASLKSPLWQNKAGLMFINLVKGIYPSLFTGCPYEGRYDSKVFDLNATFSPMLPPILPAGVFRLQFHFYTPSNDTIITVYADVLVKPTKEYRGTDFSFVNMG